MRPGDRLARVRASGDEGQLLLLVLAYTVIAGLLITVVVNSSRAYLFRRDLLAAADGAALAAANAPDLPRIYTGTGRTLPLSAGRARAAVEQYVQDAQLADRFREFEVARVSTDGITVSVTLSGSVSFPFANVVSGSLADGYEITATASARSPLTR